jgi:hypothetical protein
MVHRIIKGVALITAAFLVAVAVSVHAYASMHQGSQGSSGSSGSVTGSLPGQVLWAAYLTTEKGHVCPPDSNTTEDILCNIGADGDNIIRLVNPNGAANGNLAGAKPQTVCAMIYVFDDDQEMGECCGCPLSSAQLTTISVENNLTSDWALATEAGVRAHVNGAIAIVASAPNVLSCVGQSGACNGGCDPTNVPGYSVTSASNLLGSITHNSGVSHIGNITEIGLSDDGGGDPTNLVYLQAQCGALIGNSSLSGICNCPTE